MNSQGATPPTEREAKLMADLDMANRTIADLKARIVSLECEVEDLREFQFMYEDLCD